MTNTAAAPLYQVGIRCLETEPPTPVGNPGIADLVIRALHRRVGSLRTPPDCELVDPGVFLVLLPAGLAAKVEQGGAFVRRVRVSGVEFEIAGEGA